MRLIDADKIGLTNFEIFQCAGDCREALKILLDKINRQPTAYSVDKVVEEFDKKYNNSLWIKGNEEFSITRNELIEIVKHCGVDDDVCEWKTNDNQHMFAMWETECGTQTMIQKLPSYKYCPYCGKKIKVV